MTEFSSVPFVNANYLISLKRVKAFEEFVMDYQLCPPPCQRCWKLAQKFLLLLDDQKLHHEAAGDNKCSNRFTCPCKPCFYSFVRSLYPGSKQLNVSGEVYFFMDNDQKTPEPEATKYEVK